MIRYQVWDLDGWDDLLAEGWGHSFSYTFGTGTAEGDVLVRFYADMNGNLSRDSGEPYFDSEDFWVMQKRVFNIKVDVSSSIPGAAAFAQVAAMQARFDLARDILLRKDSAADYRAAVQFNVALLGTPVFTATNSAGTRPDPVTDEADAAKHWDAEADVVFVNHINGAAGWNSGYDWHRTIIGYDSHVSGGVLNEALMAGTIAHELGHGVGLVHPSPDDNTNNHRVMTSVWSGTFNHLTRAEARAFDAGDLSLEEPPREDSEAVPLTDRELALMLHKARAQLLDAGNGARSFRQIEFAIVDLPGSLLGLTSENTIWIDRNAAGHGWFIDATPGQDSEFPVRLSQHELQALPGSPAFGKADLLTVLFHEMGHIMGMDHGSDHVLMMPTLPLGVRRIPETEFTWEQQPGNEASTSTTPLLAAARNAAPSNVPVAIPEVMPQPTTVPLKVE